MISLSADKEMLDQAELAVILVSLLVGFVARWLILKVDYRQYPTYPNAYLIHLTTGFIAAAIGAVAVPALLSRNFTAVTFLTVAIQQFRDVRKAERDALQNLESSEYRGRGQAYIDGIAKTLEGRNYMAMIASFLTSVIASLQFSSLSVRVLTGAVVGCLAFWLLRLFTKGKQISDIADLRQGKLSFEGASLYVDDIFVMNVGSSKVQRRIMTDGLGIIMEPRDENAALVLGNIGQRQAMEHEVSRLMGLERYIASHRNFSDGRVALAFVPVRQEPASTLQVLGQVPVLEAVKKIIK